MKRILGIILAVLCSIAFFTLLVWYHCVTKGFALGISILFVLTVVAVTAIFFGLVYLILWLLY